MRIIASLLPVLLLFSCSQSVVNTLPETRKESSDGENFRITISEIQNTFGLLQGNGTRSSATRIEPIVYDNDTTLYLVHYKHGWKLCSSDKRTTFVLAYSTEEPLNEVLLQKNPALKAWLDVQSRHIHEMRNSPAVEINHFWKEVNQTGQTRDHEPEGPGWRLIHCGDSVVSNVSVPHILETEWGQMSPWNTCTPFLTEEYPVRAAVGCVNVAYGQILYWAHNTFGHPEFMYTEASCTGYAIPPSYSFAFTDSSTIAWNQMKTAQAATTGNADYSGYLMAKVSRFTNSFYGFVLNPPYIIPQTSSEVSANDINWLRSYFNVDAVHTSYSASIIISNLDNGIPTLIAAHAFPPNADSTGHAWVIDGYRHYMVMFKYYYIWDPHHSYHFPNIEEEEEEPGEEQFGDYSYDPPAGYEVQTHEWTTLEYYFLMNWGYDGYGNSVHCSINSAWWAPDNNTYPYLNTTAQIVTGFTYYNPNE